MSLKAAFINAICFTALAALCAPSQAQTPGSAATAKPNGSERRKNHRFIENKGQWDARALFVSRTKGLHYWVTADGAVMDFFQFAPGKSSTRGHVIGMKFLNASKSRSAGHGEKGKADFLYGDRSVRGARLFSEVLTQDIYKGVSARHYVASGRPRYDIVLAPGADPQQIKIKFLGVDKLTVRDDALEMQSSLGPIKHTELLAYQELDGNRHPVEVSFKDLGNGTVGFKLGSYDRTRKLVIDPVVYGSYYGGDNGMDEVHAIVSDTLGGVFMTGRTRSTNFPVIFGPYGFQHRGGWDAYIGKFQGDVYNHDYAAYIGGTSDDSGDFIQLDHFGNIWIAGRSSSTDMPGNPGVANRMFVIRFKASAITSLDPLPTKALYFGGGNNELVGFRIVPNEDPAPGAPVIMVFAGNGDVPEITGESGNAFLMRVSYTDTGNPNIPTDGFAVDQAASQYITGTAPLIRTDGVDVDLDGNMYVAGTVRANGTVDTAAQPGVFLTTSVDPTGDLREGRLLRNMDAFARKYNAVGGLLYSVLLGGNGNDYSSGIAVDIQDNAYVMGVSASFNFPRTRGVFGEVFTSNRNIFVSKLNPNANNLTYSTNMNASGGFEPAGIAVDHRGIAHMTGFVTSTNGFPNPPQDPWVIDRHVNVGNIPVTLDAIKGAYTQPAVPEIGTDDGYLLTLNPSATELLFGTYIGGDLDERVFNPFVDKIGDVWVCGWTDTYREYTDVNGNPVRRLTRLPNSHITSLAFRPNPDPNNGFGGPGTTAVDGVGYGSEWAFFVTPQTITSLNDRDGFVIRFRLNFSAIASVNLNPTTVPGGLGASSNGTVTLTSPAPEGGAEVILTLSSTNAASFSATAPVGQRTVTIPQGGTTATFTVFTSPVTEITPVDVTATFEGAFRVGRLNVAPWLSGLSVTPSTLVGGNNASARVTLLQPAPTGGITVSITSNNNDRVTVQDVFVPAGATTATVTIETKGVSVNTPVQITATHLGFSRFRDITVTPARLFTLTFDPPRISSGSSSTGTLTLDGKCGPVPFDVNLSIQGSPAGYTLEPTTFRFVEGESVKTFVIRTPIESATVVRTVVANRPAVSGYVNSTVQGTLVVEGVSVLSLDIVPPEIEGGQTAVGTVRITPAAQTGGAIVSLSISPSGAGATIPASIVVPAGATSATFNVQTTALLADTTFTITASRGSSIATDTLVVRKLTFSLGVTPTTIVSGTSGTGTITLSSNAPPSGVVASLSASNGAVTIPPSVTVPAGQSSATFPIVANAVAGDTQVVLTATIGGISQQVTITVTRPKVSSMRFMPTSVRGLQTARCIIELDAPAPAGGMVITLANSNTRALRAPTQVQVPAGKTSLIFTVATRRVSTTQMATLTASSGGRSVNARLQVRTR